MAESKKQAGKFHWHDALVFIQASYHRSTTGDNMTNVIFIHPGKLAQQNVAGVGRNGLYVIDR
jgi:hypothetical protein